MTVKAPAGVRITELETLAADQPVSSGQFRLEQETDDRTVVVITVPPGGLKVYLPVTPAQRREARGAPLLLLHYDGSRWTTVVESRDRVQVYAPGGHGLFAVRGRVRTM